MAAVVAVVAVVGLAVISLDRSGTAVSMPESINGVPRVHSGAVDAYTTRWAAEVEKKGTTGVIGLFGPSEQNPDFEVAAFTPPAARTGDPLRDLEAKWNASLGQFSLVDTTQIRTAMRGSTRYECSPYSMDGSTGTICAWRDANTEGVVVTQGFISIPDGMKLVVKAHDAVVG